MASAFTLTLAYLGEHCSATDAAGAFAAYVTGNVTSNLFGRLLAAGIADHFSLGTTFTALACLNLAGAVLVYFGLTRSAPTGPRGVARRPLSIWAEHLRNPLLKRSFAIGFCILFAFIGTFTYVNFVLVREPIAIGQMTLGFVYFVFAPSIVSTLLAGRAAQMLGTLPALWGRCS
jgi:YNFM family putative membrane transporter